MIVQCTIITRRLMDNPNYPEWHVMTTVTNDFHSVHCTHDGYCMEDPGTRRLFNLLGKESPLITPEVEMSLIDWRDWMTFPSSGSLSIYIHDLHIILIIAVTLMVVLSSNSTHMHDPEPSSWNLNPGLNDTWISNPGTWGWRWVWCDSP